MSLTTPSAHNTGVMGLTGKFAVRFGELLKSVSLPVPVTLFLLAVIMPADFSLGPLTLNAVRSLLLVLIIPLTLNLMQKKYGPVLLADILIFTHVVWMIIALGVNNPDRVLQFVGSNSIELVGGYLVARAYIRSMATFMRMIRMLILLQICLLPFAVSESLTAVAPIIKFFDKLPGIHSFPNNYMDPRWGLERAQVIFQHPILFGLFSSVVFSLCFIGMRGVYSKFQRYLFSAVIGAAGFLSLSSGAVMSFVLQIGLIFWAWVFQKVRARWVILLVLFCIAYVVVDLGSNRTPVKVFLSYATFSPETAYFRTLIFDYGMDNVWANPVFGLGLNEWERPAFMSGSMDNFWLVQAVRYGIPGFALIAVPYLWALWKIGRRNFDSNLLLWQLRRSWMITFIGLTFTLCTVHIWSSVYSFVFFLFGSGIWMISAEPESETREPVTAAFYNRSQIYARSGGNNEQPATIPDDAQARSNLRSNNRYTRFPPQDAAD